MWAIRRPFKISSAKGDSENVEKAKQFNERKSEAREWQSASDMEERNSTEGETFEVRSEEGVMFGGVSVRRYPVPQDEEDYHYVKSFPPQGHD